MLSKEAISKDSMKANANEALLQHDYAAMDITNAGGDKRQLEESPLNTPVKGTPVEKRVKHNQDASFEAIMLAISRLNTRFDKQETGLDEVKSKIRENSTMICSLAKSLEFNAAEIKDCKSKVVVLEQKVASLEKENRGLKQKADHQEAYGRRWNLRIKGMKEKFNENIREDVMHLLKNAAPQLAHNMEEIVDVVHRVGRKEERRTRSVIIRFVKRIHRDHIWRSTKESVVCREAGVTFTEDLSEAVKEARAEKWPKIAEAKREGKKAYFRGPYAYIEGKKI